VPYDIEAAVRWSETHTSFGLGEGELLRSGTFDRRGG
jgi:hypothetical protein